MERKLKYIIYDNRHPVIFSDLIQHSDIGKYIHGIGNATSAGFVYLAPVTGTKSFINATVYGESVSLNIKNNGYSDNSIIEKYLNNEID